MLDPLHARHLKIPGIIVTAILLIFFAGPAMCLQDWPTAPKTNNGKKWRIGYLEGGTSYSYPLHLAKIVKGLMELGWIQGADLPPPDPCANSRPLWDWLVHEARSDTLEFVADAYWTCDWDTDRRGEIRKAVLERLRNRDVDLMLAMGTWAGQDLANDSHSIPTFIVSSSNPVLSGIIRSTEDSGYDHVHASLNPWRYERQIRLFHKSIGFKRLGVAFEDTPAGRTYAAVDEIGRVSAECNFQVMECHSLSDIPDRHRAYTSLLKCHEELAPRIDAMYLTLQSGSRLNHLSRLLAPLNRYKIPTFSQRSSDEVRRGALMSFTSAASDYVGLFVASNIAKTLNGAKPRSLVQTFDDPTTSVAINMAVAKAIGYDPPTWLLEIADEIYTRIEPVQPE